MSRMNQYPMGGSTLTQTYRQLAKRRVSMKGVNNNQPWSPYYPKGQVTRHYLNDVMRNMKTGR